MAETHQGRIYQWPLSGPGEIAGYFGPEHRGTVLADPEGGPLFDSLAVDSLGNVCVATIRNGGITVVTPDGGPSSHPVRRPAHDQHLLRRRRAPDGVRDALGNRAPGLATLGGQGPPPSLLAILALIHRRWPRVAAVALAVTCLLLAGPVPGGAHTDLLQGSPGPAQRVGGTVDFVDLVFLGPVSDAAVEVLDPDGRAVAGEMEVADGQIIRFRMEPLTRPGAHVVNYEMVSGDGDDTAASYSFTYEPDAPPATRIGAAELPEEDGTVGRLLRIAAVALATALTLVCLVLLVRLWRNGAALGARQGQ